MDFENIYLMKFSSIYLNNQNIYVSVPLESLKVILSSGYVIEYLSNESLKSNSLLLFISYFLMKQIKEDFSFETLQF